MGRLTERVAVITGGGSGIGRATAVRFAEQGAVTVVVDIDAKGAAATVEMIEENGGTSCWFECDVTDTEAVDSVTRSVVERYGAVDVLVTAAAISVGKTIPDTLPEEWDQVFAVNVKGTYLWMRACIPLMTKGTGSIVALASQLAVSGGLSNAAYVASKGAIVSLCRTAANDHASAGIRINCILPGATETPLLDRSFARFENPTPYIERSLSRHPLGRFGQPEEVAEAALFLASDEASFTTGTELRVDGGWIGG
ncbi:MAG: glucose 1-dehydrogenase [Actinomycetota bacterium]|nr:glucose 1-dehydrogenase [Actinomycetota bacterium]MEC9473432.1 glucose 1-dehydrogenase [Actinomycetota bacterium]MED5361250.1 glucose 1-dehydrogenase [Actinomycetota bacterium]